MTALALLALARADLPLPARLADVGVAARLGARPDPDLRFRDETGAPVRLGDVIDGAHPVALALAWYRCDMVCGLLVAGLADAARAVRPPPGDSWRLLTVSYDPRDTTADAAETGTKARARLGFAAPWPFWVGDPVAIDALTATLGVRTTLDDGERLHPVAVFVLAPEGRLKRVLYGPRIDPTELEAALFGTEPAPPTAAEPVVCARPVSPPPVYRTWLRVTGLVAMGGTLALLAALAARARR